MRTRGWRCAILVPAAPCGDWRRESRGPAVRRCAVPHCSGGCSSGAPNSWSSGRPSWPELVTAETLPLAPSALRTRQTPIPGGINHGSQLLARQRRIGGFRREPRVSPTLDGGRSGARGCWCGWFVSLTLKARGRPMCPTRSCGSRSTTTEAAQRRTSQWNHRGTSRKHHDDLPSAIEFKAAFLQPGESGAVLLGRDSEVRWPHPGLPPFAVVARCKGFRCRWTVTLDPASVLP